jgi:hypothetical protein
MFEAVGPDEAMFLGLGNNYIETGDLVCIFYGSKVPIVIRECASHIDPLERSYKVICQGYLDGWMFGDYALESWWEEFERSPDSFVLV